MIIVYAALAIVALCVVFATLPADDSTLSQEDRVRRAAHLDEMP